MKKLFTFIVGAAVSLGAYAQDFGSDGLYYSVLSPDDKTCAVTGNYEVQWGSVLEIPERVEYEGEEYTVTKIGDSAFWNCNALIGVVIPNSVTEIGSSCFAHSYSLTKLDLGSSVETLGYNAFYYCPLQTIVANGETPAECQFSFTDVFNSNPIVAVSASAIPAYQTAWAGVNVVEYIPAESLAFDPKEYTVNPGHSVQLNCVVSPENAPVYYINNNSDLISIDENGLLTAYPYKGGFNIEVGAISLNGLKDYCNVYLEKPVEIAIDGMVYVLLPDANEVALVRYESEETVVNIPETIVYDGNTYSVTVIGPGTFGGDSPIEEVEIPASIKLINENNFNYCSSLKQVIIADSENTLSLSGYNFTDCRSLTDVYVGRNLSYPTDKYVFRWNDSFNSLVLGPKVTEIQDYTFQQCYSLNLVQSKNPVPPVLGDRVFRWNGFSIIVPAESVEAYKEAWAQYADYISEAIDATELYFETEETTIYSQQNLKLPLVVEPEDASVFFKSSNQIVHVDKEGYIGYWYNETGEAIITAYTLNGLSAEFKVTAKHWLTFSKDEVGLTPEGTYQVEVTKPEKLAEEPITWWSDDESIAKVDDNGLITAVAYGETRINASVNVPDMWNFQYSIDVKVYAEPTDVTPDEPEISLFADYEKYINLTFEPADQPELNRDMTWTVADPEIAEVEVRNWGTIVRGLKPGKTTITGETVNGLTTDIEVTVMAQVEQIIFQPSRMYLSVGDSKKLEFTTVPEETFQTFTYGSEDENIVTVDEEGVVTAQNLGSTGIYVYYDTPWGWQDSRWMPVSVVVMPESVRLISTDIIGQIDQWTSFPLEFTPDSEDVCKHIDWTTDDPSVVYPDSNDNTFRGNQFGTASVRGVAVNGDVLEGTVTIAGLQLSVNGENVWNVDALPGDEFTIDVNAYPSEVATNVSFQSYDSSVATVTAGGVVKAEGYGRTWIHVSSWMEFNGETKEFARDIEVNVRPASGIAFNKSEAVLVPGDWTYLRIASALGVQPGSLTWTSSDYNIVGFGSIYETEAQILYVGPGTATVTATDQNGNVASCEVSCYGINLEVNGEITNSVNVTPGSQFTIGVNAYPAELKDNLNFESWNTYVATVTEDGDVEALRYGNTNIRVTASVETENGNLNFYSDLYVDVRPASGIDFDNNKISLTPGQYGYVTIYGAADVYSGAITWESSDTNVVEITWSNDSQVELHYVSPGRATVTATDENGNVATCQVVCYGFTLEQTDVLMDVNSTFQLNASILPEGASDAPIYYDSYADWFVHVDENGMLYSNDATGSTTVRVYTWIDGYLFEAYCNVEVYRHVYVTSISLNKESVDGVPGTEVQLIATVNPWNATNPEVVWTSSREKVATVDQDGLVTINEIGYAEITVTSVENPEISATCVIVGTVGVDGILEDGAPFDIYDINGIVIKKGANADDYEQLQKGIYLIRQGDSVVKVQK